MAKIDLTDVGSGFQTATAQNANNASIEEHLNDKVLYRDNPTGEANTMQQALDMNSKDVNNVNTLNTTALTIGGVGIVAGSDTVTVPTAASIPNVAAGNIAATDVQAALNELDTEKVGLAGNETVAGDKTFSGTTILTGTLEVDGTTQLDGAVTLNASLAATEDVTLSKTLKQVKGADVASATALTLGDGNYFDVTGTTAITSIVAKGIGTVVRLHFDAAAVLTHHATDLVLPGAANITTAAGDEAEFVEYATGDWRCLRYQRASTAPDGLVSTGAWTPIISDGTNNATMFNTHGTYVRMDDHIIVQARVGWSSLGSVSGPVRISGLPFPNTNVANSYSPINVGYGSGLAITAGTSIGGLIQQNLDYMLLYLWDSTAGSTTSLTDVHCTAAGTLMVSAVYVTDA